MSDGTATAVTTRGGALVLVGDSRMREIKRLNADDKRVLADAFYASRALFCLCKSGRHNNLSIVLTNQLQHALDELGIGLDDSDQRARRRELRTEAGAMRRLDAAWRALNKLEPGLLDAWCAKVMIDELFAEACGSKAQGGGRDA